MILFSAIAHAGRRLARAWVRFYYPTLEISAPERVPAAGPVIFAANHPNSLIDPVLIGIVAGRPVRFLAKAPLFKLPVVGAVLRALGMLPAFRGSDDAGQVSRNTESLSAGADLLGRGEALGIFPEGKTHDALKVELVRSGVARIALQALEAGVTGLKIVPLGINFQAKEQFRSAVWIRVGEPIDVERWLQQNSDAANATRRLTAELDTRLKQLVVHLSDETYEPIVPILEVLRPAPASSPADGTPVSALRQRKRIADAMNYFLEKDRARAEDTAQAIEKHQANLVAAGLAWHSPVLKHSGWRLLGRIGATLFWLAAFFVQALTGTLHHLVPFLFVRALAPRLQTPGRTIVSLARLGLGIPVYALWYAAVGGALMYLSFRPWAIAVWLGFMPLNGIIALEYWPRAAGALELLRHQWSTLFNPRRIAALRNAQEALGAQLNELAAEFAHIQPVETEHVTVQRRRMPAFVWRAAVAAAACAMSAGILWFAVNMRDVEIAELQGSPELHAESPATLGPDLASDEASLEDILRGLNELEVRAVVLREEFAAGKRSYYVQADNDALRQQLLSFLNYRSALFRILWKYQNYEQIADETLRLRAFFCHYTSAAVLYEAGLKFVARFNRSDEAIQKLNEGEPIWGIPPRLYDTIRSNLASSRNNRVLADAHEHYLSRKGALQAAGFSGREPYDSFHAAIERSARTTVELAPSIWKEKSRLTLGKATAAGKGAAYEAQKMIATWIGDTKIRSPRKGRTLLDPRKLEELRAQLKPGDILLERRNWFLSNAFLPGYWPHAALYIGTPEELAALGVDKDPRVQAHWKDYVEGDGHHRNVIVEALSEGVVFASLEHSIGGGDSVAVLRPRLPPEKIREALCRGMSHAGKPYDFEFDFFSTDKIVCTELVFRSYDGDIHFPLVEVLGTRTLPAIEMVRKFNAEFGRPDAQLEFIAFLDGDESTGQCRTCDVQAFMSTIDRPGMTFLQSLPRLRSPDSER